MNAEIQTTTIVFGDEAEYEMALALLDGGYYPLGLCDHNGINCSIEVYTKDKYDVTNAEDLIKWSTIVSTWSKTAIEKVKNKKKILIKTYL